MADEKKPTAKTGLDAMCDAIAKHRADEVAAMQYSANGGELRAHIGNRTFGKTSLRENLTRDAAVKRATAELQEPLAEYAQFGSGKVFTVKVKGESLTTIVSVDGRKYAFDGQRLTHAD